MHHLSGFLMVRAKRQLRWCSAISSVQADMRTIPLTCIVHNVVVLRIMNEQRH